MMGRDHLNKLKKIIKTLYSFREREIDWWIFTLLPIVLIIIVSILMFDSFGFVSAIILFAQQILAFSIVLSSTDLGLKSRDIDNKQSIGIPLLIIIISLTGLIYFYLFEARLIESDYKIIIGVSLSVLMSYFSILLYNNNPKSIEFSPRHYTEQKEEQETEATELFEPNIGEQE